MGIKLVRINPEALQNLREELKKLGHFALYQQVELDGTLEIASLAKIISLRGKMNSDLAREAVDEIEERRERFLSVA